MTDSMCVSMKLAISWPNHKLSIETQKGLGLTEPQCDHASFYKVKP